MSHKLYVIAKKTGKFLSRRRWSFLGSHLASAINQLFYSMSNVDFDMKTNGESRALTICRDFFEERSIFFDVGANVGDWTHQAVSTFPGCTCYAFEVVPETSEMLKERYKNNQRVIVHNFGLSDRECTLDIYKPVKPGANASAFLIQDVSKRNMAYSEKYECKARPGAAFMSEKDLTKIDFLKIDVEGMELSVLKGFDQMIDKVRIIQFEYGVFNILSRTLLLDLVQFLNDRGFAVGQIYPNGVRFFDYHFQEEKFMGNNYIAAKHEDIQLIDALQGRFRDGPLRFKPSKEPL